MTEAETITMLVCGTSIILAMMAGLYKLMGGK